MEEIIGQISSIVGGFVLVGGGGVALAYGLFKWLGSKWIEKRFNAQLKQLDHRHAEALARLKPEIESLMGGALKLQSMDFEVLPRTWSLLHEAVSETAKVVRAGQTYYDINLMSEDELEEFLNKLPWSVGQKQQVRQNGVEREKAYHRIEDMYRLNEAKIKVKAFADYVSEKSIFYDRNFREQNDLILDYMKSALVDREFSQNHGNLDLWITAEKTVNESIRPLKDKIEILVRQKLLKHKGQDSV